MCYLFQRGTKQYATAVIKSLVPFLLVFLLLQWEWLGKQISQLSTSSFHPSYSFHTHLNSHCVAARVGLSSFFSSKKQQKDIQCLAGDHKETQIPDHFNALRNSKKKCLAQ